jgi:hypothetical protein
LRWRIQFKGFGVRRTCSVCPVKRRVFAEFFFWLGH